MCRMMQAHAFLIASFVITRVEATQMPPSRERHTVGQYELVRKSDSHLMCYCQELFKWKKPKRRTVRTLCHHIVKKNVKKWKGRAGVGWRLSVPICWCKCRRSLEAHRELLTAVIAREWDWVTGLEARGCSHRLAREKCISQDPLWYCVSNIVYHICCNSNGVNPTDDFIK